MCALTASRVVSGKGGRGAAIRISAIRISSVTRAPSIASKLTVPRSRTPGDWSAFGGHVPARGNVEPRSVGDLDGQRSQWNSVHHPIALAVAVGGFAATRLLHRHDQRVHEFDVVRVHLEVTDPTGRGGHFFGQRSLGVRCP